MKKTAMGLMGAMAMVAAMAVQAAPVTYNFDPDHTYPSFEADHFGGISTWRGKFTQSSGKVVLDAAKKTGQLEAVIKMDSFDSGNAALNTHAKGPEILDVAKYPTAVYKGTLSHFKQGKPTAVVGQLTLHGVTKPLTLKVDSFKCFVNPMSKKETCGADASAKFDRSDFGIGYGKDFGFKMQTKLRIQVEGIRE
ncbi:YceI family protein [Vitreoscilla massiliensis]|uniref:YceI family protein n=1 Tax=Vitreoscilla massiliensis TaxID=1689272 RepID=A0ABY4DYA3_9NEIS|nr:YceI family protein [Vitreoscilla massiliensis]UOO88510.1 YceI family protein [Vitreoscilla massiliensis]